MDVVLDGYSLLDQDPVHLKSLSNPSFNIVGVTNYVAHLPNPKVGTRNQLDAFWGAGLMIAQNFEQSGTEWRQGYQRGLIDGRTARQVVTTYGLIGPEIPCSQSTDTGVGLGDLATLASYQRGFNDGYNAEHGAAYGPGFAMEYLFNLGLISYPWQWKDGHTPTVTHAVLRQTYLQPWPVSLVGCPYDVNIVNNVDWGQWPKAVDPPIPPQPPEDDNVPGFTLVRHNNGPIYRIDKGETQKHVITSLQAIACDFDTLRLSGDHDPHIVDLIDDASHNWQDWLDSIPTV